MKDKIIRTVIPESVLIFGISLRVPLLSVDEDGELCWIPQEKDGGVVSDLVNAGRRVKTINHKGMVNLIT